MIDGTGGGGKNSGRDGRVEVDKNGSSGAPSASSEGSLLRERVGLKLKAARRQQQFSLRALAALVGFSASFLSQVELGQVSPSLGSLDRIAQALGMHLSDLLSEPATANGPVLHHRRHASLHSEWSRATVESLLPADVPSKIGVVLVGLEPGGQSGKWSSLSAAKELAFCVRGKATVTIADQQYHLGEGDSIFYDTVQTSRWENASKRRAEILLISLRSL
jgi:transcriptional regulator with XRE-family HTH domain